MSTEPSNKNIMNGCVTRVQNDLQMHFFCFVRLLCQKTILRDLRINQMIISSGFSLVIFVKNRLNALSKYSTQLEAQIDLWPLLLDCCGCVRGCVLAMRFPLLQQIKDIQRFSKSI